MSILHSSLVVVMLFAISVFLPINADAQVVKPTGKLDEASSQLVFWYDESNMNTAGSSTRNSFLQVTNTNDSEGVWIHVQVYQSFPTSSDVPDDTVRCAEIDFVDFLTARDTHLYIMGQAVSNSELGPGANPLLVGSFPGTKGFVLITPIAAEEDNRPIAWQHMVGTTGVVDIDDSVAHRINAMGRDAVDFTTGEVVPDGTVLDGTANGFVVLQPGEMYFNLAAQSGDSADIVGITFIDEYNSDPTLGYRALPGETNWSPFTHDNLENRASCTPVTNTCFNNFGYNDVNPSGAQVFINNDMLGDLNICQGVAVNNDVFTGSLVSWTRLIVQGYDPFENQLGVIAQESPSFGTVGGADWMNSISE